MSRIAILAPLRHSKFRLLFLGQLVSDLGDWLSFLALVTLIAYRWEMGPGALAALSIALIIPQLLVAPFAGVWVDRWPTRAVMITCDLVRAVLAFGLVFTDSLWQLLLLVVLLGAVSTFFNPARQAAIVYTVPEDGLLAANALSQLSLQSAKVIGPALGGLIISTISIQAAFIADSCSYLLSALFISLLPTLKPAAGQVAEPGEAELEAAPAAPKLSFWQEFKSGIQFIFHNRALGVSVISMTAAMFIIFTFDSLGSLALKDLNVSEQLLGLAVGCIGLGTAVGAVLVGQWGQRFHPLSIMASGNVASGVMVAFLGTAVIMKITGLGLAWLPVWLLIGLAGAAMFVPYGYIIQRETPPEMIGRVASTAGALQTAFQLLAPPLGAVVAEWLGVGFVFAFAGGLLVVVGIVVLAVAVRKGGLAPEADLQATAAQDNNFVEQSN